MKPPRGIEVVVVPYVLGREGQGMGAGPFALQDPIVEALKPDLVTRLSLSAAPGNEVAACFDLNRQVARAVTQAALRDATAVVLTGNCHSQQGVLGGLRRDGLGLVWLDCHADFHTPETTPTGFFDGTALSMCVGDCWTALCATVPGFRPLPADDVVLVGARDVDEGERTRLDASEISEVPPEQARTLPDALPFAERLSLHVDLDVLDPRHGRANAYATPGGLAPEELLLAVRAVAARGRPAALTLSAYDPAHDPDGRVRDVAVDVARAALAGPTGP